MIESRNNSEIVRQWATVAAALALTTAAWGEEPVLDQGVDAEVYAAHTGSHPDGSLTVQWAVTGEQVYRHSGPATSFKALCDLGESWQATPLFAGSTVVVHCRSEDYMDVVRSVVLHGEAPPWSAPEVLIPASGEHLVRADGSALLHANGELIWETAPLPAPLVAHSLTPTGQGARAFVDGQQVVVQSFTQTGEIRWTAALPVSFDRTDSFEGGPAFSATAKLQLDAGPDGGVAIRYARRGLEQNRRAQLLVYSAAGDLVANHALAYTEAPVRYVHEQQVVLTSNTKGVRVLDLRDGSLRTHPVGDATVDIGPSGTHLSVRTDARVLVLATPDLRDQTTWTPVFDRPVDRSDRVTLDDAYVVVVGQGRVRAWALDSPSASLPTDPQEAITAIRAAVAAADPGEPRSRVVRDAYERQFAQAAATCARDASPAHCESALSAWAEAERVRHALDGTPARSDPYAISSGDSLPASLESLFGPGVLVDLPDGFAFLLTGDSPEVRVFTGAASTSGATVFRDERVRSERLRAAVAGTLAKRTGTSRLMESSWGSDRLFARTVGARLNWISPVHGGAIVVCDDGLRVEPLGPLAEVSVDGEGYHPERTAQHTVFTYASPCDGYVVGRAVDDVQIGTHAPPTSPATTDQQCSGPCELTLTAPGRRQSIPVHAGEGAMGRVVALGDLNRDGVDDYSVWTSDAASYGSYLYLSMSNGHWLAVARSFGDT